MGQWGLGISLPSLDLPPEVQVEAGRMLFGSDGGYDSSVCNVKSTPPPRFVIVVLAPLLDLGCSPPTTLLEQITHVFSPNISLKYYFLLAKT